MPAHKPSPDGIYYNPDGTPWTADFQSQRPPFQKGNELHLKSGAFSPRHVTPVAEAMHAAVIADDDLKMLRMPAFQEALWDYCESAARLRLIKEWVSGMTIQAAADSERGKTSALELERKWSVTVGNKRARLGLDPVSYAKIHATVNRASLDLATLLSMQPKDTPPQQG